MRLTEADLAAKGYGPDGSRLPAPRRHILGVPRQPAELQLGGPPSTNGDPADTSKAGPDRRSGHTGNGSQGCRLSSRAIAKLQPEQRLQIEVVAHWRPRLVPGARLLGINGELPGGPSMIHRARVRREMGYLKGTPDLQAIRPGHTLWLEAKVGTDQTDEQAAFADWAHSIGHGYGIFTSIADAGVLLRVHGMVA